MSYGGGYGRSRGGYGDSNGHANGYALSDVYSTCVLLSASTAWARETNSDFPHTPHHSSAVTGAMGGADSIANSAVTDGMSYLSQPLQLDLLFYFC